VFFDDDYKQLKSSKMRKVYSAVLHLKNKDAQKIYLLGGKVLNCLRENQATYPEPDPSLVLMETELIKLDLAIKAKDGTKQKNQVIADQAAVVYDSNNEPITKDIPGKVYIRRIEDGSTVCSAKIYVEKLENADRYKVETTTSIEDPESWKTVLDPASLFNIEISGLPRGKDVYIRVTGGNSHGWGIPSDYIVFIPR
jgi:hypothetical protein